MGVNFSIGFLAMKQRCLPTCLIIRNVCLLLLVIASGLVLSVELQASANQQQQRTEPLRRVFVYQILLETQQP
jgi:hypothetical protein